MELIYNIKTRAYYSPERDEYVYDEKEIHYSVDDDDVVDALADILVDECKEELNLREHGLAKSIAKQMIDKCDALDYLKEEYKDELKEYFRDSAMDL